MKERCIMFKSKKEKENKLYSAQELFELMKQYKINYYRDTNVEIRKDLHDLPIETKAFNPNPNQPDWGEVQDGLNT